MIKTSIIERTAEKEIGKLLKNNKAIIILGPRQVGKTTLLKQIVKDNDYENIIWFNGDLIDDQELFEKVTPEIFAPIIGLNKYLIIDEAQRISDIGIKLKILYDNFKKNIKIIATGSSSFDLANKINEPLTGRKRTVKMFPLSIYETGRHFGILEEKRKFENRLLYGLYPEIVSNEKEAKENLLEIANDNLYKDIYKWENIKNPIALKKLVKALAYQIGQIINYSELAELTGLDRNTVKKYLNLLEQSYIVFRLGSFSNNHRVELRKSEKIYFYDTGIRNALIGNFNQISERNDIGNLFENFIISEIVKIMSNSLSESGYFWRTKQGQEIDFILEKGNEISAFEIKWREKTNVKFSKTFINKYEPSLLKVINKSNFREILEEIRKYI